MVTPHLSDSKIFAAELRDARPSVDVLTAEGNTLRRPLAIFAAHSARGAQKFEAPFATVGGHCARGQSVVRE
jgi:hypothetical protein